MPQIETHNVNGIVLIDKQGNKYCDLNRYQNAIICIVYDASSIEYHDVHPFANSNNPSTLPSNNGIFITVEDATGLLAWKDITYELNILRINRFIDINERGIFK